MSSFPCLVRLVSGSGQVRYRLGERPVDRYLEFVAGRCRPNTLRAVAFDLKAFFAVVAKDPVEVTAADVFEFLAHQRGDRTVIRLADRESGLSARTIARRLSSVSGLYAYLVARGDTPVRVNPVPRGLMTRRQGGTMRSRMAALVRVPRTLPRILSPEEADRLVGALRRHRDRAMVLGMLLAGLRRCEVLGLRFEHVQVADRRLAVVEGKGGHHRVVPAAGRFFDELGAYLHDERPVTAATDRVFVVLKGPRRGLPLSAEGLDEILDGARRRAGLAHATCHQGPIGALISAWPAVALAGSFELLTTMIRTNNRRSAGASSTITTSQPTSILGHHAPLALTEGPSLEETVRARHANGYSQRAIARELNIDRRKVKRVIDQAA